MQARTRENRSHKQQSPLPVGDRALLFVHSGRDCPASEQGAAVTMPVSGTPYGRGIRWKTYRVELIAEWRRSVIALWRYRRPARGTSNQTMRHVNKSTETSVAPIHAVLSGCDRQTIGSKCQESMSGPHNSPHKGGQPNREDPSSFKLVPQVQSMVTRSS